jgi:hypothetical protein
MVEYVVISGAIIRVEYCNVMYIAPSSDMSRALLRTTPREFERTSSVSGTDPSSRLCKEYNMMPTGEDGADAETEDDRDDNEGSDMDDDANDDG